MTAQVLDAGAVKGSGRGVVHLQLLPPHLASGNGGAALMLAGSISHEPVESPASVFKKGDVVRALLVSVPKNGAPYQLSTKLLEKVPGEYRTPSNTSWRAAFIFPAAFY